MSHIGSTVNRTITSSVITGTFYDEEHGVHEGSFTRYEPTTARSMEKYLNSIGVKVIKVSKFESKQKTYTMPTEVFIEHATEK